MLSQLTLIFSKFMIMIIDKLTRYVSYFIKAEQVVQTFRADLVENSGIIEKEN